MSKQAFAATTAVLIGFAAVGAEARDQIRIVGSSTVFPFSTAVAERFGRSDDFKTPLVESTGSGGGIRLFCSGVGVVFPDIANASRRMKDGEAEICARNGVTDVTEVNVGFDGIVLANSNDGPYGDVSTEQIYLALAKDVPVDGALVPNPYEKWSDIDASLPDARIQVLGPPPTSGTRDAFEELAMLGGAKKNAFMAALRQSDKDAFEDAATTLREDGAFIEAGENDNLIVQKLSNDPNIYGIFGYSFMLENNDKIHAWSVNGVAVGDKSVQDGSYPMARSLFFYIKNAHVGVIPGLKNYAAEFVSEAAVGPNGYTIEKGLIPLDGPGRETNRSVVDAL